MRLRLLSVAAALLLLAGFAAASFRATRQPLSLGDYLAVWGLKARAIHATGDLASVFRVDPRGEFSHPEYPPLWPLVLAGTARLAGRYDELLLTLLRPLLLALAAALTFARTRAPLPWRLLAAAAVTLLPYFQTAAYAGYAEALLLVLVLAALLLLELPAPTPFTPYVAGLVLALADLALLPSVPWLLGAAILLALAPATRRARRPLLAGAAAYAALLVASFAFARVDVVWLVTWTWDRLALVPVAALLPAVVEAAAEPFRSGTSDAASASAAT